MSRSIVKAGMGALPSIEKARNLLAQCREIGEVKKIKALAQAVASCAASEQARDEAAKIVLLAKARVGEMTAALPQIPNRGGPKRKSSPTVGLDSKRAALAEQGVSKQEASECEKLHELQKTGELDRLISAEGAPTVAAAMTMARIKEPEKREAVIAKVASGVKASDAIREVRREAVVAELEDVETRAAKAVEGVYDVLVIDPPWPMEKIERDERPNQVAFDYPTMSEDELRDLEVPCAEDCHVWLWTTHKFLPMAFRLLEAWDLKYVCAFVWHKPGGFQPIGLPQYNCEFALYARRGSPVFVDTKALPTCFNAPRGRHSEKPEEFYEVVRRVTAGRRLDMFNRRAIAGFDTWGKEAHDAAE